MAKQSEIFTTQTIKNPTAIITNADNLAMVDIYTATADDAIVRSLSVVTDDTSARNVTLYINNGSSDIPIAVFTLAANQGTNGTTPAVDLLNSATVPGFSYDQNGKRILPLQAGYKLRFAVTSQMTAGKQVSLVGVVEEY